MKKGIITKGRNAWKENKTDRQTLFDISWWMKDDDLGVSESPLYLSISLSCGIWWWYLFHLGRFFLPQAFVGGEWVSEWWPFLSFALAKPFLFLCALLVSFWFLCFFLCSSAPSPTTLIYRACLSTVSLLSFPFFLRHSLYPWIPVAFRVGYLFNLYIIYFCQKELYLWHTN